MKCVKCGCTEERACVNPFGEACYWISHDPPVCSECDPKSAESIEAESWGVPTAEFS